MVTLVGTGALATLLAARLGVPAPVNETLWLAVRALGERGAA